VEIKVVSEQLGHTTTQITRDIHLSVMPHVAQAAVEATAAVVPRRPSGAPSRRHLTAAPDPTLRERRL
jgi:hypothetical protein